MTDDNKYNGWTNRETWLVKLWIDNERESHLFWRDQSREILKSNTQDTAVHTLTRELESWCDEAEPELTHGLFTDLLTTAISRVDWYEIAQSMVRDCQEESNEPAVNVTDTRVQVSADGALMDVTDLARAAGFIVPVVMTAAAWEHCVQVPNGLAHRTARDRIWDVVEALSQRIERDSRLGDGTPITIQVTIGHRDVTQESIQLKAVLGSDDNAEPVITIMLPEEE